VPLGRQDAIELRRGEQHRAGDAIEFGQRQDAVRAQPGDRPVGDFTTNRPERQVAASADGT
jgi:hypothetical protein